MRRQFCDEPFRKPRIPFLDFLVRGMAGHVLRIVRGSLTIACIVGIAVARAAVGGLLLLGPYPREWIDVVRVGGMRGALCLALALAIPASIAYREAIIDATFAVSLATLAIGSFAIEPVVRRATARQIPSG